jgi:hypothetical protein
MASLYQLFTRSRLAFADGLCWLHSAPALPLTVDRLLLPLAHAQAQIAECDIALGGGSRDALVLTGEREQHLSTAIASLDELVSNLCQKAGLLRRQVPVAGRAACRRRILPLLSLLTSLFRGILMSLSCSDQICCDC